MEMFTACSREIQLLFTGALGYLEKSNSTTDVLRGIAHQKSILSLKQSIVSMKAKRIIGYEALSRGVDPASGDLISPEALFSAAERSGMSVEIDRTCREKAMQSFSSVRPTILMWFLTGWLTVMLKRSAFM